MLRRQRLLQVPLEQQHLLAGGGVAAGVGTSLGDGRRAMAILAAGAQPGDASDRCLVGGHRGTEGIELGTDPPAGLLQLLGGTEVVDGRDEPAGAELGREPEARCELHGLALQRRHRGATPPGAPDRLTGLATGLAGDPLQLVEVATVLALDLEACGGGVEIDLGRFARHPQPLSERGDGRDGAAELRRRRLGRS